MMKRLLIVSAVLIFAIVIGIEWEQNKTCKRIIYDISQIQPHNITEFDIYPKLSTKLGNPISFKNQDQLIDNFFQSLRDLDSYKPNHDRVATREHTWILEIFAAGQSFQIRCYIPSSRKEKIVVGEIGSFEIKENYGLGYFQSRQLYQWYQQYSHRWLTPEGSPPAPPP